MRRLIMGSYYVAFGNCRNYNPEEGRGSKKPVSKEAAMEELLQVVGNFHKALCDSSLSKFLECFFWKDKIPLSQKILLAGKVKNRFVQ